MASRNQKRSQTAPRSASALKNEAASIAASVGEGSKRRGVSVWPEWSDADINAEKWEVAAHKGKDKEKGKSPVVQHFFEDPEGKIDLPPSPLKVDSWRRPLDYITDKTPVIVDPDSVHHFDLMSSNEHVHESETMRWITSQILALWRHSATKPNEKSSGTSSQESTVVPEGEHSHTWRPWEHIHAINKVGKGPNVPLYNAHGKYVVKLYWMGCWRKITIDDTLPFDEHDRLLLPSTTLPHELWPMLLSKALLKIASLDYNGGSSSCEFGDFSVIHCLTGWLPETIPLQQGHLLEIWKLLQGSLPEFKLPEAPADSNTELDKKLEDGLSETTKDEIKLDKDKGAPSEKGKDGKKDGKDKEKEKGKDEKKEKKDKDKDKARGSRSNMGTSMSRYAKFEPPEEKTVIPEEQPLPEHPEMIVFASYSGPPKYPVRVSVLSEMADASERLRQSGLSHLYSHPVLLTKTRSCPLEAPPPPEKIPSWKLIRPRKKKAPPTDEPMEAPEVNKPIQCVEIRSPFLSYKVSSVPIPTDVHRARSALERGSARVSSRPGTANEDIIEENDEVDAPPGAEVKRGGLVVDDVIRTESSESSKPSTPKSKKRGSGTKRSSDIQEISSPEKKSAGSKSQQSKQSKRQSSGTMRDLRKTSDSIKDKNSSVADSQTGDVTAASTAQMSDVGDVETVEETCNQPVIEKEVKVQDIWMDFDVFCRCFKTLHVFHKSNTYLCNHKHSDLKNPTDERSPLYLFIDSLKPTEIVVSYSALSRWNEPPAPPAKEESKITTRGGKDKQTDRDSKAEILTMETTSIIDGLPSEANPPEPITPGLLVAEPYSWKSLVIGQPILRLRSTSSKAAVLSLPEGRHVLRFSLSAPLGYHVHLCSTVNFVFGDEEKVMSELTKESCRFVENATQVISTLGKCIANFHDALLLPTCFEEFHRCHCPYYKDKHASLQYHHKLFLETFYNTIKKVMNDAQLATPETAFAWRAFFNDATTKNPLGLPYSSLSRPSTGLTTSDRGSAGGKKNTKKQTAQQQQQQQELTAGEQADAKGVELLKNREWTPDDLVAVVRLQKLWRGYYARKIKTARTPGTELNLKTQELLQKAYTAIEANTESHGLALFRSMFKTDPDLMQKYPFHLDEWNKISLADYQGSHPDQPPNSWFIVFREIFHVSEEMLCVPKLYVSIQTCMMRVIDNDTREELPRVFTKVAPHVYKKNKNGYTFVAEARTLDQPLPAGRWRMRLIGSLSPLPAPIKNEVNASFHSRELRDYYIPNEKNIVLRYVVKVTEDHLVSLQLQTSKSDVYIRLQVLDGDTELVQAVGKGHVVLPAILFQKDPGEDVPETKRSSSRQSNKGGRGAKEASRKRVNSAVEGRGSRSSSRSRHSVASMDEEDDKEQKPHKYVIQAVVMRSSWPLSEVQWAFVQTLKEIEKNELKVSHKQRDSSPPRSEKATAASKGKDKGGKGKGKEKGSRPPSQQFDMTKPHWLMRVVSDGNAAEEIEVKKDTERADEIRAMKKAWEAAEPGRAAKALQARLKYLNTHMVKVGGDDEDEEENADEHSEAPPTEPDSGSPEMQDAVLSLEPPCASPPKEELKKIDITPFLRKTCDTPRLRDEAEVQRQMEEKQKEIAAYRAFREQVEHKRELDRLNRNQQKIDQLQLYENMQVTVDSAREAINQRREAYREKFLAAERLRSEEIAALEAEQEKRTPTPKGKKSGKKSASGKRKK